MLETESSVAWGPLPVPALLSDRLKECGFVRPMPIQTAAMPAIAAGENVVINSATGSGKVRTGFTRDAVFITLPD